MTRSMNASRPSVAGRSRRTRVSLLAVLTIVCGLFGAASGAWAACLPAPGWLSGPSGTIGDPQPTFSWGAVPGANFGYTLYILQLDGTVVVRETGIAGTSFRPHSPLPLNVDLRYKVKGEGACGAGAYASSTGSFRVVGASCPPTIAPQLIGPSGTIRNRAPTFRWRAVPGAEEYVLVLLYASDQEECVFPNPQGSCHETTAATRLNLGELPVGVEMRWKVKTECGDELYGPFSPSMYFEIDPGTGPPLEPGAKP